jgi:hypothetical protein
MAKGGTASLRDVLKDSQAYFFLLRGGLKGGGADMLRLWEIAEDSIVIDMPSGAPLRRTVVGLIPTVDGSAIFEIEGRIEREPLPDQMEGTIRVVVEPSSVRRVNRRAYPRASFAPPIAGTATPEGSGERTPVRIINLSAGGLRAESESRLPVKEPITFRFEIELNEEVHEMALRGRVVYEIPMESGHSYGISFARDEEDTLGNAEETPIDSIEKTVDLMNLVNKLLVKG